LSCKLLLFVRTWWRGTLARASSVRHLEGEPKSADSFQQWSPQEQLHIGGLLSLTISHQSVEIQDGRLRAAPWAMLGPSFGSVLVTSSMGVPCGLSGLDLDRAPAR